MSCSAGRRCGSDPALLWLWCWLAAAALVGPLAQELPCAAGVALKRKTVQLVCIHVANEGKMETGFKGSDHLDEPEWRPAGSLNRT